MAKIDTDITTGSISSIGTTPAVNVGSGGKVFDSNYTKQVSQILKTNGQDTEHINNMRLTLLITLSLNFKKNTKQTPTVKSGTGKQLYQKKCLRLMKVNKMTFILEVL